MFLQVFGEHQARHQAGKGILEVCSGLAEIWTSPHQPQQALSMTLALYPAVGCSQGLDPSSPFRPPGHGGVRQSPTAVQHETHISTCVPSLDRPPFCSLIRCSVWSYTLSRSTPVVATFCNIFLLFANVVSPKIASIFSATSRNLPRMSISEPNLE